MKYEFRTVEACNMCGAGAETQRVLGRRLNVPQRLRPSRKAAIATTVVRCGRCGLIFANPLPVPERLEDHYGVEPEEYWNADYFEVSEDYMSGIIERADRLLTGHEGRVALDIGAGIGKGMLAMSRAGFDVYGIEPSPAFHRMAVERMGVPADRLRCTSVEDAEFSDASFDFIYFAAVLEHLVDPSAALEKAIRWLRPGGVLHVEVPSARWMMSRLLNVYYRLIGSGVVANICPMHNPFHLYEFTPHSFRRNGERLGYEIALQEFYVCDTYLPRALSPIAERWMRWTDTGMQLAVWLRRRPGGA
jgi:SAM-dependent methyltransferase